MDLRHSLLTSFDTNHRINLYLIENIPPAAWSAEPPNGKGRGIPSIFAHIHNVRLMWLKSIGGSEMPAKQDAETTTPADAAAALEASHGVVRAALDNALATDNRIKGFKPDAVGFATYLIAHDAHHRGQISLLARLCGHPISKSANFGLWSWGTR